MRQQQRALKRTNRDLERDRHSLERQEKQLVSSLHACDSHVIHVTSVLVLRFSSCHVISLQEAEIKKAAKRGDKQVKTASWDSQFEQLQVKDHLFCFSDMCSVCEAAGENTAAEGQVDGHELQDHLNRAPDAGTHPSGTSVFWNLSFRSKQEVQLRALCSLL